MKIPSIKVLSYLNPKRVAALEIAQDMIENWDNKDDIKLRLNALKNKDETLYRYVVQELEEYGYRVPSDVQDSEEVKE